MSPVKDFSITYDPLNKDATFSEGDVITGSVTFSLSKETKVKSLFVKAKGDGRVQWSEGSGDGSSSYSAHRRYFKVKEFLVEENAKGTILPQGDHSFKFSIEIPQGDMPSSFNGDHGSIIYLLEAKLSKSWQWPTKATTEISFISKSFPPITEVMVPQSDSVTKEMGTFSKTQVEMSATADKKVCIPGDTVTVAAVISNPSSKTMTPKFTFYRTTVYRSSTHNKTCEDKIMQAVGDLVTANSEKTETFEVTVPDDTIYTIHNCDILSVEYSLKVYLDISFAFDPEVVFPLVIAPASWVASSEAFKVLGASGDNEVDAAIKSCDAAENPV